MATTEADRRAHRAGVTEALRTDAGPPLIIDVDHPPGPPPVAPVVTSPPPESHGAGLAIPVLYGSLALVHLGGDQRDQFVGAIYALMAVNHIFFGE